MSVEGASSIQKVYSNVAFKQNAAGFFNSIDPLLAGL